MEVLLAKPRGFCAGVNRAILIVERVLKLFGAPVYVCHEIVHNAYVIKNLCDKGVVFVENPEEVPVGGPIIFSAHGVSKSKIRSAESRRLNIFDATCPLVAKVHSEITKMHTEKYEIIMIGHRGHPEVIGAMGQCTEGMHIIENERDIEKLTILNPERLGYVTQTTLSVDETDATIKKLKQRFPLIKNPKKQDICYATQNRQEGVKFMAMNCQLILVVGSRNSSNSNRLHELAKKLGINSYMIDDPDQINPSWFVGISRIGITAGASAPEVLVQLVVKRIREFGATKIHELHGVIENVIFPLPHNLIKI